MICECCSSSRRIFASIWGSSRSCAASGPTNDATARTKTRHLAMLDLLQARAGRTLQFTMATIFNKPVVVQAFGGCEQITFNAEAAEAAEKKSLEPVS